MRIRLISCLVFFSKILNISFLRRQHHQPWPRFTINNRLLNHHHCPTYNRSVHYYQIILLFAPHHLQLVWKQFKHFWMRIPKESRLKWQPVWLLSRQRFRNFLNPTYHLLLHHKFKTVPFFFLLFFHPNKNVKNHLKSALPKQELIIKKTLF